MRSIFENRVERAPESSLVAPKLNEPAVMRSTASDGLRSPIKPLKGTSVNGLDTVLIVIADAHKRQHLADALAMQGCKSLMAGEAEEALEIAKSRQPSLIVLDISLPGKDGFEVCAELRDGEGSQHIPVILLSHGIGAAEKLRGLRLGAVDYINEPFDSAEVAAQVCSQLKLERVRRELTLANFDLMTKQAKHHADLAAAAAIQKSLLPQHPTEKLTDVSVAWRFLPLDQVGGDLLGYTWLDDDHLAAYVIDVCGHGLPAAMMTAAISISLTPSFGFDDGRASAKQRAAFSPGQVLEGLDREYPIERFERPFTITYLVLNRKTGEFRCSRAGHPMPIIVRKGGRLEAIEAGGTIIGLDHMLPFDEGTGKLESGDTILLYSDGVTECANESGTFGLEGLSRVLGQSSGCAPDAICERVMTELLRFNGGTAMHDDVTMLALSYDGSPRAIDQEFEISSAIRGTSSSTGGN